MKRFTAPIVCMCGSTKFKQTWISENARLSKEGFIVLSVGLCGHHERKFPEPEEKAKLDNLHKRKIDLADWVWILDVDGYIGDSTKSEIEYAKQLSKPIRYLSKEFPNYVEPLDEVLVENEWLKQKNKEFTDRLQPSPYGDDKIDELEECNDILRDQLCKVQKEKLSLQIELEENGIETTLKGYYTYLPKIAERELLTFTEDLKEVFSEWSEVDTSVGLFGMTTSQRMLADAIIQGLERKLQRG